MFRQSQNQYTVKPCIARMYCDFGNKNRKDVICEHFKESALESRFKWHAKIYNGHEWRVWMVVVWPMPGTILYDTDRGDGLPEVARVRRTSLDRLPLLIGRLKTERGQTELAKRLKNETMDLFQEA